MPIEVVELNRDCCKSYLVVDPDGDAAIIDPLFERVDRAIAVAALRGVMLRWIIDTHTHADHRTGAPLLHSLTGVPVVMHRRAPSPAVDRYVSDGDALPIGTTSLRVIDTPGHTPDSMSLLLDGQVFSGDTLLIRGTGRTDLGGGDPEAQFDSLHERLLALPDDTVLWSGPDYRGRERSTIGEERRENPRLKVANRTEYAKLMRGLNLPLPTKIQEALQANTSSLDPEKFAFPAVPALANVHEIAPEALTALLAGGDAIVLDVRELQERTGDLGSIAGSLHVPLRELPARLEKEVPRNKVIVCVCRSGSRSATAAALLTGLGYPRVFSLSGGMVAWSDRKLPAVGVT